MTIVGNARAVSVSQILAVQLDKLQRCDKILQKTRGATIGKRSWLEACLKVETRFEWQRNEIQKARERGVRLGKQKRINPQQITELQNRHNDGVLVKTLMRDCGVSIASVYWYSNHDIKAGTR